MKRLGILTRDCAGINAAIRAVVRTAGHRGVETVGIMRGYEGLIDGEFIPLDRRSVSNIISRGGTILKTSRSERFRTEEGRAAAAAQLKKNGIDGLIVVGGNGTLSGAGLLAREHDVAIAGVPATIDNDIPGVEPSLGADTAINVAMDALDKIRDTATSLERIFIVEVMGRACGYLAMQVSLAGGCEEVLLPERETDMALICREIRDGHAQGKISWIIIVAEGRASAGEVAEEVSRMTGLETRIAVLGHIQRGGRPTAFDRVMASRLGSFAVETLLDGKAGVFVRRHEGRLETLPLEAAAGPKRLDADDDYRLLRLLT